MYVNLSPAEVAFLRFATQEFMELHHNATIFEGEAVECFHKLNNALANLDPPVEAEPDRADLSELPF